MTAAERVLLNVGAVSAALTLAIIAGLVAALMLGA
jgi:hypothetical protein